MKKITKYISISLLIISMTAAVDCDSKTTSTKPANETAKAEKAKTKDFKSADNKLQLTIPEDWSQVDELKQFNPAITLAVGNKASEKYAAVVSTSKSKVTKDMTVYKFFDLLKEDSTRQVIASATILEVMDAEINGRKAITFIVKGEVNNRRITYIYAIVDSPNAFNTVYSWTFSADFDKNKEELTKVVKSFKEL